MLENVLEVQSLSTYYETSKGKAKAVDNISFTVQRGEMLGLIGESGCGKSTVAKSILRLVEYPARIQSGQVILNGEDLLSISISTLQNIRWKEIAIIPQSAMNSLNPVYCIGDQIIEAIVSHEPNVTKKQALERTCDLLELVGIDQSRWKDYPHEFSGGMKQRVVIAMALACNPQLVISDESTTGLDVLTQAQVIGLMKDLQRKLNLSFIVISHDLHMVTAICDRIAIMYAGQIVEVAHTKDIISKPKHPYSRGLFQATPVLESSSKELTSIPGNVPNLVHPPTGCRFHPRCSQAMDKCKQLIPELLVSKNSHYVACFLEDNDYV